MSERTAGDVIISDACNTYVMSCHLNSGALYSAMRDDIRIICKEHATLKAQRDELLTERNRLLFHECQLVESLKSYMNKYGPGYSCTDTLAYDNATGVLAAIANAEKDKP